VKLCFLVAIIIFIKDKISLDSKQFQSKSTTKSFFLSYPEPFCESIEEARENIADAVNLAFEEIRARSRTNSTSKILRETIVQLLMKRNRLVKYFESKSCSIFCGRN
jgi:hypothetical protein